MQKGMFGRKTGMTQVFGEDGGRIPVTVVDVGGNVVVDKREGAVRIGFGRVKKLEKEGAEPKWRLSKAEAGVFLDAGIETPRRHLREMPVPTEEMDLWAAGEEIGASMFDPGDWVDVSGTSKGKGFSGVMKRHGFAGASRSHGTHEYFRHGGAIGQSADPARVFPGMKMPGQHGNNRVTIQNLQVVKVLESENAVAVKGGIPGPKSGLVFIRSAVKKHHG